MRDLVLACGAGLLLLAACGDSGSVPPKQDAAMDFVQVDKAPPDLPRNEAGNLCATPTGPGTTHDETTITASVTWAAADSPHLVKHDIQIGGDTTPATLTIEQCAVVKFESGAGLTVAPAGKRGAALIGTMADVDHPVTLTGTSETPGAWKGVYFGPGNGADDDSALSSLDAVSILWAGGASGRDADAALFLDGSGKSPKLKPSIQLSVSYLTISGSAKYGIYTTRAGHLKVNPSAALTITGNEYRAVRTEAEYVVGLPGGTYTGNKVEGIEMQGGDGTCVCSDEPGKTCAEGLCARSTGNWGPRGVPYVVKGLVHIGHAASGTEKPTIITIPGTETFRMSADGGIEIGVGTAQRGALRLPLGSSVTFTPDDATVTPGFWRGIVFGLYSDWSGDGSVIMNAKIEGAGKAIPEMVPNTCGSASIDGTKGGIIFDDFDPKAPFPPPIMAANFDEITKTTFSKIDGHAIVRGWNRTEMGDTDPDYTAAGKMNVFDMVSGCKQTNPKVAGACSPCTP